jgi:hypothetical protein
MQWFGDLPPQQASQCYIKKKAPLISEGFVIQMVLLSNQILEDLKTGDFR